MYVLCIVLLNVLLNELFSVGCGIVFKYYSILNIIYFYCVVKYYLLVSVNYFKKLMLSIFYEILQSMVRKYLFCCVFLITLINAKTCLSTSPVTSEVFDRSVPGGGRGCAAPHPEDVQHKRQPGQHLPPAGGQQRGLVLPPGGGGVRSKE